jgi:hypothetical protein
MNRIIYKTKLFVNKVAYNLGIVSRDEYNKNQLEIRLGYHADHGKNLANNFLENPLDFINNAMHNAEDNLINTIGDNIDNAMEHINDFFGN